MSRMGDQFRLNKQFRGVLDRKEIEPTRFRATQGDGTGTVKVPGKPNYIYIRRLGRTRFEECLNVRTPNRYDLPVVVGYLHELPGVLQVLNVDWARIIGPGDYPYVPSHHASHELHNDEGGDDVVWVQSQQILPLLVYPTSPPSMFVGIFGGWYPWKAGWHYFESTTSADLTGYIPLNAGEARFVLICIDGETETLHYESGSLFPQFLPPADYEDKIPPPPLGKVPLGAIYFIWAMTEIEWGDTYDLRLSNQPVGGSIVPGPHSLLDPSVHDDTALDSPTQGSLIYGNPPTGTASQWDELVIGTAHQLFKVNAVGTDPAWAPFDWDEISLAAAADMVHDHSAAAEGGPIPLGSLGGGARGSIIRREAASWAEHAAKNAGWILIGDNTDIVSHPITGDITLGSTGTVTVIGFQTRSVAADMPTDGQIYAWDDVAGEWKPEDQSGGGGSNPTFKADGVLAVAAEVDGGYVCPSDAEIAFVYLYCETPGTAGNTIVDVHLNGVTIFTVQANRPTLAWNDPDGITKSGVPDVVALVEGDLLTVDIDQIATAAADMTVVIALAASAPVGVNTIGARVYNSANINVPNAVNTTLTFDSERFDTDGLHSVVANTSRLICTKAGVYIISATISWASNNVGERLIALVLNGVTYFAARRKQATTFSNHGISTIYELAVGDYIEVVVSQTSGGALNVETQGNFSPEFSMVKAAKHSTSNGCGEAAPPNIYVASNGNDANDGLSSGSPKATVQAGVDLVPDIFDRNVTVHVASGAILESGIEVKGKYPSEPGFRLLIRGYMNSVANQFSNLALFAGTMSAPATNAFPNGNTRMTDVTKNFGAAGVLKYRLLHITGNTGYNSAVDEFNWYMIEANTATTIDIAGRWNGATPDATTTYEIFHAGECIVYGNGVNTAPVLKVSGCKNVVSRFMSWMAGDASFNPGAAGYPVVQIIDHRITAMPHLYLGTEYPELVWLGVGFGALATDNYGVNIQNSQLPLWAFWISGWTTSTQGDGGMGVGRSTVELRHFRMENLDYMGVYLVGGRAVLACGTINNQATAAGFRSSICADAVSLLIEGRYLWLQGSYRGAHSLASSHMYFNEQNVIENHGNHGCYSQAASQIELNGLENRVRNNGGWGAYAQHSAAGDFSRATYVGNAAGAHGSDATSSNY